MKDRAAFVMNEPLSNRIKLVVLYHKISQEETVTRKSTDTM